MNQRSPQKNTKDQLIELYEQKKKKNPAYSLRSFAKDLGVSPTLLSLVFSGKRPPSANLILKLQSKNPAPTPSPKKIPYHSPQFSTIEADGNLTHWYEIAMLDLITLDHFKPDVKWIAKALGISSATALETLEKLHALQLITMDSSTIKKNRNKLSFSTKKSLHSVRQIHREFIEKALLELRQESDSAFSKRRISGTTMAINPKRLDEAKRRVDAFQQEMSDFLSQGDCTELYQLNLQLFPLIK